MTRTTPPRMWAFWERIAPDRPVWLHLAICPFCRGYRRGRKEFLADLGRRYAERATAITEGE